MAKDKTSRCDTCAHVDPEARRKVCVVRRMTVTQSTMPKCDKYKRRKDEKKDKS